jgi:hypothetical protein
MEIWKIINEAPKYEVSNFGNIRKVGQIKNLKGSLTGKRNGKYRYAVHGLMIDGKRVFNLTHRIVAKAFIENPMKLNQVNHIDENTFNNSVSNLEWVSNKLNTRHSNKKEIYQLTLSGEVVKKWNALYEIGDNGLNKGKISEVVNNKRKTAYGYKWKYKIDVQSNAGDK